MTRRPPAITEGHLQRRAIGYMRQSSDQQVRDNIGSTALQRDLVNRLAELAWPRELIELVDDDLGVSGSNPGGRQGFNRLIERMKTGEIGLVAVTQDSRLARNLLDFAVFADVARRFDVLLAVGDQVLDFRDPNAEFIATILGSNAARENRVRVGLSQQARRKKAEAGIAPAGPPVGYVRLKGGAWVKDPDPRVREVIQLVFDKFFEVGSARGLVRHLRRNGIQIPRKPRAGRDRWADATYDNVLRFLRHPAYSGTYVYGRTTVDERADRYPKTGKHRFRRVPSGEWICVPDHHEPYVPAARWAEIQRRLAANRITRIAPPGRGPALVQGLLHCAVHGLAFVTTYSGRQREPDGRVIRRPQYACRPQRHACESAQHTSVMAHRVDAVIEAEVLATLAPPSLDLIQLATREALREHDTLEGGRRDELRRLKAAVAEVERAFDQAEPDHVHLRRRLADRLNAALGELKEREMFSQLHPLTPPLTLTDAELTELRTLLNDLPRLWRHPRVSAQQRKAVVRTIIKAVHATPGPKAWLLEIDWVGGARTQHPLPTDAGVRAQLVEAHAFIRSRFAEGGSVRQISQELNALQMGQERGPWNMRRVKNAIVRLQRGRIEGLPPLPPRRGVASQIRALHETGLTPREIVARLREDGAVTLRHYPPNRETVYHVLRSKGLVSHSRRMREEVERLLRLWAPTASPELIANRLNEQGFKTGRGRPWRPASVVEKLNNLGLRHSRRGFFHEQV